MPYSDWSILMLLADGLEQVQNRLLAYMQYIAPIYTNCFCIYVRNIYAKAYRV